jgi:two-component system, LytTR family, sensor kinase
MKSHSLRILAHASVWLVLFFLPYILSIGNGNEVKIMWPIVVITFIGIGLFYLNALLLIPELLYKKKKTLYFIFVIGILIICAFGFDLLEKLLFQYPEMPKPQMPAPPLMQDRPHIPSPPKNSIIPFLLFFVLGAGYRFYLDKIESKKLMEERIKKDLENEVVFLKGQINPHFLLNMLNNVVALNRTNPMEVEPVLIKLSELMHYSLYLSDQHKVELKEEAEYIKNYIELQKIRLSEDVQLDYSIDIEGVAHYRIVPLLLLPFIENAFKHGIGFVKNPAISIDVKMLDGELILNVKNSKSSNVKGDLSKGGVGLANVRRRLELAYPNRHTLDINVTEDEYTVELKVICHD